MATGMPVTEAARAERRAYPRFQFVKSMEVTVGRKTISGYTYDIGQGGIAFIAENLPATGLLSIRIVETGLVFTGKLVGQLSAGKPGLFRYQVQFAAPLMLEELAGIVETHIR